MAFSLMQGQWNRHKITLHKEKRAIRHCIQQVQRELYTFRKKFFLFEGNDSHPVALKEFLLHNKGNRYVFDDGAPPLTSNEFLKWIDEKAITLNWSNQILDELKMITIRASSFEKFVSQSLRQLKNAYEEHISKYCQSFINKVKDSTLKVPHNYERNIQIWKEDILRGHRNITAKLHQLKTLEKPFFEYVNNYHQVTSFMLNILDHFPHLLHPMSRWLLEDDCYARKLQNELYNLTKCKAHINEAIRCQQFRVTEARNNFQRKVFTTQILWRDVKDLLGELNTLRDQQSQLKSSQQVIDYEQQRKKVELAEAETRFMNRASNSSTLYDILVALIENRKLDIQKLNISRNQGSIELSRILKAMVACDIKLCVANSKYESSRQVQQEQDNILQKELKTLTELQNTLRDVQDQMAALHKIKDLKIQTLTIQTLFEKPYIVGFENTENDVLDDALNLVANEIGFDWICFYQILPFHPPRCIRTKIRDIEDIKKKQLSTQEMALESLQKWKHHNRDCSVSTLVNLLQRLDKIDIIMQLKRHSLINN